MAQAGRESTLVGVNRGLGIVATVGLVSLVVGCTPATPAPGFGPFGAAGCSRPPRSTSCRHSPKYRALPTREVRG